jgi:hydrogenase expression/formation protein HypC
MEVEQVDEIEAVCVAKGVRRTVSLLLMAHETLEPGDHVLVHVGHAIQKLTEDEAAETWRLLDEVLRIEAHEELRGPPWGEGGRSDA